MGNREYTQGPLMYSGPYVWLCLIAAAAQPCGFYNLKAQTHRRHNGNSANSHHSSQWASFAVFILQVTEAKDLLLIVEKHVKDFTAPQSGFKMSIHPAFCMFAECAGQVEAGPQILDTWWHSLQLQERSHRGNVMCVTNWPRWWRPCRHLPEIKLLKWFKKTLKMNPISHSPADELVDRSWTYVLNFIRDKACLLLWVKGIYGYVKQCNDKAAQLKMSTFKQNVVWKCGMSFLLPLAEVLLIK